MKGYWSEELQKMVTIPENEPQLYHETCESCKPFKKYGTTRLVKEGERICSVCGKPISP